jgi:hypothetical protein
VNRKYLRYTTSSIAVAAASAVAPARKESLADSSGFWAMFRLSINFEALRIPRGA